MATVLIVEDDGLVARQMAQAVRSAGYLPLLAPDARSAVREAAADPVLVLLDLGLPDVHGEAVLDTLQQIPSTAQVPILVVTGRTDDAVRLQERHPTALAGVLLKPVNPVQLTEAVRAILRAPRRGSPAAIQEARAAHRREVMRRLITDGPDRLAGHVYRRMCADRPHAATGGTPSVLTWAEIAEWAKLEGLVGEEEANLLGDAAQKPGIPTAAPTVDARDGKAHDPPR